MSDKAKLFENYSFLYWSISIVLNMIWVVFILFSLDKAQLAIYYSAENLILPSMFNDLFNNSGSLSAWQLSSSTNFFPDMFFFMIINAIVSDFRVTMLIYSLLQYAGILILANLVVRQLSSNISLNYLAFSNLLIVLLLFVTTLSGSFEFTYNFLSIGHYLGPMIMTLASLLFLLKFLKYNKKRDLYFLFIAGFLGILSNRLFFIMFVLPSLTLFFFISKEEIKKKIIKIFGVVALFTISGYLTLHVLKLAEIVNIAPGIINIADIGSIINSLKIISTQYLVYFYYFDLLSVVIILALLSFILTVYIAAKYYIRIYLRKERHYNVLKAFFLFFLTSMIILVFLRPLLFGFYNGWSYIKHNIHVIYLLVFNYAFIIYYFIRSSKKKRLNIFRKVFYVFFIAVISYTLIFPIRADLGKGASRYFNYTPGHVDCIYNLNQNMHYKYGLAEYSIARSVLLFSNSNAKLIPFAHDSEIINYHFNAEKYYSKLNEHISSSQDIFVIVNAKNNNQVISAMGEPEAMLQCSDSNYRIFSYPSLFLKSTLHFERMREIRLFPPPCHFERMREIPLKLGKVW